MSQKNVRGYLNVFRIAAPERVEIPFYSEIELSEKLVKLRTYLCVGTELLVDEPPQEEERSLAHKKVRMIKALLNGDPGFILTEHMQHLELLDLAKLPSLTVPLYRMSAALSTWM